MTVPSESGPSPLPRGARFTANGDVRARFGEVVTQGEFFERQARLRNVRRALGYSADGTNPAGENRGRRLAQILFSTKISHTLFVDAESHDYSGCSWICRVLCILIKVGIIEGHHPHLSPLRTDIRTQAIVNYSLVDRVRFFGQAPNEQLNLERYNGGYEIPNYKHQLIKLSLMVALAVGFLFFMRAAIHSISR